MVGFGRLPFSYPFMFCVNMEGANMDPAGGAATGNEISGTSLKRKAEAQGYPFEYILHPMDAI